jgi:hypothetical protein
VAERPALLEGETYAEIDQRLGPALGLVGVAAGYAGGDGALSAVYPSAMLLAGIAPGEGVRRAVAELTGRPELGLLEPSELRAKHGLVLYRFGVSHAAEAEAERGAEVLYRGQRLVALRDVDERKELGRMALLLGDHMRRRTVGDGRRWEDVRMVGDRRVSGGGEERTTLTQVAMMMVAIEAYQRHPATERGGDGLPSLNFDENDLRLLRASLRREVLAALAPGAKLSEEELAAALTAGALLGRDDEAVRSALVAQVKATQGQAVSRGLLAWCLRDATRTRGAIAAVVGEGGASPMLLVNQMPWLGWAELEAAGGGAVASAALLRQMRAGLWGLQVQAVDAGADRQDQVGGLVFAGGGPVPTAQTARAVAFLATMLGDARVTTREERAGEIVRLVHAVRYLRQLQVDRTLAWMAEDRHFALGGVRASTLDQRVSIDATSMTLLAVLELMSSLDTLADEKARDGGGTMDPK